MNIEYFHGPLPERGHDHKSDINHIYMCQPSVEALEKNEVGARAIILYMN